MYQLGTRIYCAIFCSRHAFFHTNNLNALALPDELEAIGEYAFSGCESLEAVIIPGSVASIDCNAFQACERLRHVIIKEGVVHIGKEAFKYCVSLQKIVLPESILSIAQNAFADCDQLAEVELPLHLKGICEHAFPPHTQLHYRAPSALADVADTLIHSLPEAGWMRRREIVEELEQRATDGDVTAMMHIAGLYRRGKYIEQSATKADMWYEKAAEKGCLRAKWKLLYKQKRHDPNFRIELFKLVRAGCEDAIRFYATYDDD